MVAIQNQVESLVAAGRFREAAAALDSLRSLSTSQQALRGYLQYECEGPVAAAETASRLLQLNLSAVDKALCLYVIGRASAHAGDIRNGLRLLETAVRTVQGNAAFNARSEYRLTASLLAWIGVEPALARLPQFRRAVTASGDPFSTIGLHLICAEIEIKRYDKTRAEDQLSIASGLLERFQHLAQEAKLLQLRSNHAALCSDFRKALDLAQACLGKSDEAGWLEGQYGTLGNLSYFSIVTGELDKASDYLNKQTALFGTSGPFSVENGTNRLELALAQGKLEIASELVAALQEKSSKLEGGYSYAGLWYVLAKTRWLIQTGRLSEASQTAAESLPFAKRRADRHLYARLRLITAEAFARSGQFGQSLGLVADLLADTDLPLEHVGEVSKVTGILTSNEDIMSAKRQFVRAIQILDFAGLAIASRDVAQILGEGPDTESWTPTELQHGPTEGARSPFDFLESWSTIADLVQTPELAGRELLGVIRASGAASAATLVEETVDRNPRVVSSFECRDVDRSPTGEVDRISIEFFADDGRKWRVDVVPQPEPAAKLAILAMDRLLRRFRRDRPPGRDPVPGSLLTDHPRGGSFGMVVAAENMTEILNITRRVATSNVTVLFTGETGTGKELLARALHDASRRNSKPFIPFNCNAVAREMLDSQLFGYRRGAFTGAHDAFPGVIRAAAGGTLFLDEIGEMSLDVQPKLLRFLESGEIHPLGEPRPITVDVRIVAATNANLEQLVAEGRFREDLFYRLNVVRLQVPPLRERREEIPLLVQHFIDKFSRESHKAGIRVAEETMEYLVLYKWPGNVRQLANEIRRIVAFAESGAVLMPEHLSPQIAASRRTVPPSQRDTTPTEFVVRMDQPMSAAIEHLERSMIQYAMSSSEGRFEDAAQRLGLSRKGLYLKRQRLKMAGAALREDDEKEAESQIEKLR